MQVNYLGQKVGMLVAILVSSVVMGFMPLGLKKVSPVLKKRLLSYGNAFAGGVFFAIGFLHLLAESNELMMDSINPPFPLSFIMAIVGFTCVFFVEKVIFAHHHGATPNPNSYSQMKKESDTGTTSATDEKYGTFDVEGHDAQQDYEGKEMRKRKDDEKMREREGEKGGTRELLPMRPPTLSDEEALIHHDSAIESGVFAYILTFVLSLHSLISGVALGMDNDISTLISLFVAIISHKWIEAFALGVAINKSQATSGSEYSIAKTLKLILIYSIMEPLGIIIGIILSAYLAEDKLTVTQAFVLSLAAGTFIYVAVVDILPAEFSHSGHGTEKYIKFMLVVVGIVAISIVVIVFSHSHTESNSHDVDGEF